MLYRLVYTYIRLYRYIYYTYVYDSMCISNTFRKRRFFSIHFLKIFTSIDRIYRSKEEGYDYILHMRQVIIMNLVPALVINKVSDATR